MTDPIDTDPIDADPIDGLLRRDASLWQPPVPPGLDDALGTATGRRPRSTASWLAVAAGIAVIGGAAVLFGAKGDDAPGTPAGGGASAPSSGSTDYLSGPPRVVQLQRMTDAGVDAAVQDVDPLVVNLIVETNPTNDSSSCGLINPTASVDSQTSNLVRITVTGQMYLPKPTSSSGYTGFSCLGSGTTIALPVRLGQPLGSRTLKVGHDTVDVLPAQPPAPSYLPPGYVADGVQHPDLANHRYASSADYRDDSYDRIVVKVGPDDELLGDTAELGSATVDGRKAHFTGGRGDPLCLTWSKGVARSSLGELDRQVCSAGRPDSPALRQQILRVARSLPSWS